MLDTSNFHKKHPLYDASTKNKLGLLKSEFPKAVISQFVGLAAKCYSLKLTPYHVYKTVNYIKNFSTTCKNALLFHHTDIESAIFNIDFKGTVYENNLNSFFDFLINTSNLKLEVYYKSKIHFYEYVEIFQDEESTVKRLPKSESFYDDKIFANIKEKCDNLTDSIYFFEIDENFDIFIYKYDQKLIVRPCKDKRIMSEAELLTLKSKTCKGIPYHLTTKLTHDDYLKALKQNVNDTDTIEYDMIKITDYQPQTVKTKKISLRPFDPKRVHFNEEESVGHGNFKIPSEDRLPFYTSDSEISSSTTSDSEIDSDEDFDIISDNGMNNTSDNESGLLTTSDSEIDSDLERIDKISDNVNRINYFFSSRANKFPNLFKNVKNSTNNINECIGITEIGDVNLVSDEEYEINLSSQKRKSCLIINSDTSDEDCENLSLHKKQRLMEEDSFNNLNKSVDVTETSTSSKNDFNKPSTSKKKKQTSNPFIIHEADDSNNEIPSDSESESSRGSMPDFIDDNEYNDSPSFYHRSLKN